MFSMQSSESLLKTITSILFRIIIVIYSVFLLIVQKNALDIYYYPIGIALYLYLYYTLFTKSKPTLRIINDYLFIILILYDKDYSIFYNQALLFFPIINSPNHTSTNRQPLLLFCLSVATLFILNCHENIKYYIYISISFFCITLITYFEHYRSVLIHKTFKMYDAINKTLKKKNNTSQLPEVYNLMINQFDIDLNFKISQIIGFKSIKNYYVVKNSSSFVHSYDLYNVPKEIEKNRIIYNNKILINDQEYSSNLCIRIDKYIFVLLLDNKEKNNIFKYILIYEVMIPILTKIIGIIELEDILSEQKYKVLNNLNTKSRYISNIMKSTHYMSNQFSPITNYFAMKNKYTLLDADDLDTKEKLSDLIVDEEKRAKVALDNIKEKSLRILDKEESPFIPKDIKKTKYKHIYMVIQNIWLQHFFPNEIITKNFDNNFNKSCTTDIASIELVFTDICENIRKYSIGYRKIEFDFKDNVYIRVINDIKDYKKNKETIQQLVRNFNNDDRLEINRRNSYGLIHIKESTNMLGIETKIEIDDDKKYFITSFIFKGVSNE